MNTALGGFAQGMAGGMQAGISLNKAMKDKKPKSGAAGDLAGGLSAGGQTPGFELGKPLVVGEMGNGQMAGEQPTTWGTLRGYAGAYGGSRE